MQQLWICTCGCISASFIKKTPNSRVFMACSLLVIAISGFSSAKWNCVRGVGSLFMLFGCSLLLNSHRSHSPFSNSDSGFVPLHHSSAGQVDTINWWTPQPPIVFVVPQSGRTCSRALEEAALLGNFCFPLCRHKEALLFGHLSKYPTFKRSLLGSKGPATWPHLTIVLPGVIQTLSTFVKAS